MAVLWMGLVFILLIDLPPLIRKHAWRGVIALCLLLVPTAALLALLGQNVGVPSTLLVLGDLMESIGLSY